MFPTIKKGFIIEKDPYLLLDKLRLLDMERARLTAIIIRSI